MPFLAAIAGMLALFSIATGLVLLHRVGANPPAKLLTAAGWILLLGGAAAGVCTTYTWFRYRSHGDFHHAHMGHPGMMHRPAPGMGPGMQGRDPGAMPRGGMPPAGPPSDSQ